MSNETPEQTLTANLKRVQERYRRRSLESRLEDVADDLRDIKLQAAIMEELFEQEVEVDSELAQKVKEARRHAGENEYDALEDGIDQLEQKAKSARSAVEQTLNKRLVSYENQVNAMVKINERIDVYNHDSLEGLHSLLAEWNWREAVSVEETSDFGTQLEECRSFGTDMRDIYEDARSAIIEPLADEGIEDVVESILGSESVHLAGLTAEEREKLAESDLGDYLAITLG